MKLVRISEKGREVLENLHKSKLRMFNKSSIIDFALYYLLQLDNIDDKIVKNFFDYVSKN